MKKLLLLLLLLFSGCGTWSITQSRPDTMLAHFHASPNFEPRRANFVILHHTSNDTIDRALTVLTHPLSGVSSHYLIGRDGKVLQLVAESQRAWHAGASWWGGQTDMNSASIGIELDNNGREPFPPAQIEALLTLLREIRERHAVPRANFLGHADIAPARKTDPSVFFPWDVLAAEGFGLWCDKPLNTGDNDAPTQEALSGADFFLALTALGYDPHTPQAALTAFRRHFYPAGLMDTTGTPSAEEIALLDCLLVLRTKPPPVP